jgi:hypothetical protein
MSDRIKWQNYNTVETIIKSNRIHLTHIYTTVYFPGLLDL